ncbi:E3 ubiquitin-protein ligase RNF180 [Pyxicephalus adspersus]|uniref:E3 ubiquitin-protein ligase RNF180 n=1 Tax=Pyxicephalus adspersus TaxID=30357 RepID=A0AAV3AN36_PYXAD|nr:TPA: hypothetical protein GDO54_014450 [Pyxicephalus adspersus]
MSHKGNVFPLRCWKCRKCVANSNCLIRDGECAHCEKGVDSSIYQGACNIWHVEAEESPDWIKREIEKVHWTAGKLNCPYCRSRLGAFNFVGSTKCSCGHLAVVRLCKSKIDVGFSVTEPSLSSTALPAFKLAKDSTTKSRCGLMEPYRRKWDLNADKYKPSSGLLMEALCLEVPASNNQMWQTFLKTTKEPKSSSRECKRAFSGYFLHRKSKSLDLHAKELPKPNENFLMLQMSQRQTEVSLLSSCSADQPSFSNRSLETVTGSSGNTSIVLNEPLLSRITHEHSNSTTLSASISNAEPSRSMPRNVCQATAESTSTQITHLPPTRSAGVNKRLSKREINRLKNLRRKQRKREKWLLEHRQINISNPRTEDEEEEDIPEKESYTCAVCLDVYFNPYMCYPCRHIFCEQCLRTLARDNPSRTPCPLCRTIIAIVHFQTDLSKSSAALFPNEYLKRKQSFHRASCSKWPLPSCNRIFRVFGDFRRHMDRIGRRQFPHAGYRFDFEDESHGWRFNLDMIIIYFYSMNWVIGFIVFCLLFYYFFFSA